ncbi:MAG: response regulator transcription factor [Thermomicrobiales bacterium]|nr:response regulator transcription factor [Thermomicrobiales bacterium]
MSDRPLLQARKHYERPHVLIVADDPELATFLNEGLPLGGFWTTVISSGLQVLEVFRLRQFDLIIMDYGLRSFNAEELMLRLRGNSSRVQEQAARTSAPVVVISERPIEIAPDMQRKMGIERMLHAPIELDELVPELHRVFEEWRANNPDMPMSDDPTRN